MSVTKCQHGSYDCPLCDAADRKVFHTPWDNDGVRGEWI